MMAASVLFRPGYALAASRQPKKYLLSFSLERRDSSRWSAATFLEHIYVLVSGRVVAVSATAQLRPFVYPLRRFLPFQLPPPLQVRARQLEARPSLRPPLATRAALPQCAKLGAGNRSNWKT